MNRELDKTKEKHNYAKEEDHIKDLRSLCVVVPLIIIGIFCVWLFSKRNEEISKSFEGVAVDLDEDNSVNAVMNLDGTVTYASKIYNKIVGYVLHIELKNEQGDVLFTGAIQADNIDTDVPDEYILNKTELQEYDKENETVICVGDISINHDFTEVILNYDDGKSCFMSSGK